MSGVFLLSMLCRGCLMGSLAPAAAPKEESKPKDATEPADQQINKSLPKESEPSATDKVQEAPAPVKDKAVEKTAAPKREEKSQKETPKPAVGSRGETRVGFIFPLEIDK